MFLQSSGGVSAKAGGVHIVVTKRYASMKYSSLPKSCKRTLHAHIDIHNKVSGTNPLR